MEWIKVWVQHAQMTAFQEGVWIRLLKLAATPENRAGYGRVGVTENIGYTSTQLSALLGVTPEECEACLNFFENPEQEDVETFYPGEEVKSPMILKSANGVIDIVKWNHYQGEYLRKAEWRKRKMSRHNVPPNVPPKKKKEEEEEERRMKNEKEEKTSNGLAPIREIVERYKTLKGFTEDPEWNAGYFPRFSKSAKWLLTYLGSVEDAVKCLEVLSEVFNEEKLEWTLETVCKRAADWKKVNKKS